MEWNGKNANENCCFFCCGFFFRVCFLPELCACARLSRELFWQWRRKMKPQELISLRPAGMTARWSPPPLLLIQAAPPPLPTPALAKTEADPSRFLQKKRQSVHSSWQKPSRPFRYLCFVFFFLLLLSSEGGMNDAKSVSTLSPSSRLERSSVAKSPTALNWKRSSRNRKISS